MSPTHLQQPNIPWNVVVSTKWCYLRQTDVQTVGAWWKPPREGWAKLKTDSSVTKNPELAGSAAIIWDSNERWIGQVYHHSPKATSIEAKLWGLRDGLGLANSLNIRKLETELAATAIISLSTKDGCSNPLLATLSLIAGCSYRNSTKVLSREDNRCADAFC